MPKIPTNPSQPTYQYSSHQPNYSANVGTLPNLASVQQRLPTQPQWSPPQNLFPAQSQPTGNTNPNTNTNPRRNFTERKPSKLTLIPMPYVDLLPSLISNQMAVVSPRKVYQSPFPRCPNVRTNPLTSHGGSMVNAMEEWEPRGLKQMRDVSTSRRFILEALREVGMICLDGDKGDSCLMHSRASHNVDTCLMAEELLQGMMDNDQFEVCSAKKGKGDVCMQLDDKNRIKKHVPFPYKSDKAVPWKYAAQGPGGRKDASVVHVKDDLSSAKVTNISSTSGMTHSGRIFVAPELLVRSKDLKGKAKADMGESDKAGLTPNDEVLVGKITKEGNDFSKKGIFAEEATEFLKVIQQSEFKVIEQLNKTPARISLMGLLMNSEPHRALLVKILNEAHEWHSKFGGVHGELRKVRVGLRAYVRQQEENHLRKKGEKLSSSARATSGKNTFCHINESFVSAGWMCEGQVTVINEETPRDQPIWVWSCPPEFELGNWQVIKQPGISMANSISNNESCESSDTEDPNLDFEKLINQAEKGEDEE
ncbi:hypothetical protein HKD37_02G004606 [Glycine soja]